MDPFVSNVKTILLSGLIMNMSTMTSRPSTGDETCWTATTTPAVDAAGADNEGGKDYFNEIFAGDVTHFPVLNFWCGRNWRMSFPTEYRLNWGGHWIRIRSMLKSRTKVQYKIQNYPKRNAITFFCNFFEKDKKKLFSWRKSQKWDRIVHLKIILVKGKQLQIFFTNFFSVPIFFINTTSKQNLIAMHCTKLLETLHKNFYENKSLLERRSKIEKNRLWKRIFKKRRPIHRH